MALNPETVKRNLKIGQRIAAQRVTLGLTQRQLAVMLGLDYYTFISQVETGQATLPPSLWDKAATILMMDPVDFTVDCLHTLYPDIYQQLFKTKKPSRVVESLRSIQTKT